MADVPPATHNALAASLAAHLRSRWCRHRVTWENLSFSDWSDPKALLHCRPDVFSIVPTLNVEKCRPWTHEVKISRGDFLSDIRSEKWRQYMAFSCRVFFATPQGLIDPAELPNEAGLWELRGVQWMLVKPARYSKQWELPPRHLMKLILGRWGTFAHNLPSEPSQQE